eukprot:1138627-Pelagomonas_calceolata.AAC.7
MVVRWQSTTQCDTLAVVLGTPATTAVIHKAARHSSHALAAVCTLHRQQPHSKVLEKHGGHAPAAAHEQCCCHVCVWT